MPEIKGRNARQKSHAEAVAAYGGNRKSERGGRGKNTEVIPYKAFPLPSLSTLAVLVCLYFFGGPSMEDFAWTISAGILIGTYSSIFIASPAALFFSRKHGLHEEVRQAMKAGA